MTLQISLLFSFSLFISSWLLAKLVCNISPVWSTFTDKPFLITYCSLPFSSSSQSGLGKFVTWGVSFNEVRIIESVIMFTLDFFSPFFLRERKGGDLGIPESGFDWVNPFLTLIQCFETLWIFASSFLWMIALHFGGRGGGTIQAWDALAWNLGHF